MTTFELLQELHNLAIDVTCSGDDLTVRAPKGIVTPEIRAALLKHKPVLVAWLTAEERMRSLEADQAQPEEAQVENEISLQCCVCGAEVACYSEQGAAYCQAHWDARPQALNVHESVSVQEPASGHAVSGGLINGTPTPVDPAMILPSVTPHVTGVGVPFINPPPFIIPPPFINPPPFIIPPLTAWTPTCPMHLDKVVHALIAQWDEAQPTRLVLDLETTGLNPRTNKVITLALGTPENVTIIDLRPYYAADPAQQQAWREALQQILQRDALLWIGHNLKFDGSFLAQQFGVQLKQVYDTMLVEKLLHVGEHVSASLQASAARYGIAVSKEARSWFIDLDTRPAEWGAALPDTQLSYMRQDIAVPYQLYERQQSAIVQHDLAHVVSLEQQALPAIVAMELHGVCVDSERWRSILAARHKQKEALERQIKPLLGEALTRTHPTQKTLLGEIRPPEVNLASSQQVLRALYRLGIRLKAFTKEALQECQQLHPVIPLLIEWKVLEKFESSFGENLLSYVTADGRIHATFDQLGAASGRIICRAPNLQQIPRPADEDDPSDLRRCFIAPAGYKLLSADLSNIELRILAEITGDEAMLRFFAEGKDLHSETARLMFKLPAHVDPREHLVNGKKARDIAKTINFGLIYGMGARGLSMHVGVDMATARQLMQVYFATYKAVAAYVTRSGKQGIAQGYAVSLSGRKRFFTREELKGRRGEAERSAKNHPIQGTNADILKCALALLYSVLPPEVHVVLTVHDEIVLECPDEQVQQATRLLKDAMMQACREYLKVVHIPETEVLEEVYWKKG